MAISKQTKLTDYEGFVEKFVPKKTTDDCYTPQAVYDEVLRFVGEITDTTGREIVRPFWPGGDYERYDYPDNCIVVDNPPFSIYAKIVRFYLANHIDFLLFAPALTQTIDGADCCYLVLGVNITYQNGAVVPTSFTTNLCKERVWCNPDLYKRLDAFNEEKNSVNKLRFPVNVTSPALLQKIAKNGEEYRLMPEDCTYLSKLDNYKHNLFGRGWLLSDKAAAEKEAAEKAASEKAYNIELSYREKAIIDILNKQTEKPPKPLFE